MAIANKNDLTHVVRTTQQWESSYDKYECIPEGVLCIEFTASGQALAKIGNGRDIFSKLPYIGGADLTNYFTKEQTTECINDILKAKRYICIKGILNNKNQLPTNATCGDLYFVISQNQSSSNKYDEYVYSPSNTWENLGSIPIDIDLSEYAKIVYVDEKIDEVNERIDDIEQHGTHTHANKDILDLITAAFTAEEKDKLSTLYNYDDTELRELITQASHTHSNKDILDAISAPFTKEDKSKLDQLNPYDDSILKEKITALERLAHEHSNKRILDQTTASFTKEYERKMRWIRIYTGCTGMEEGIAGLVPAAQAGEEDYVLSGAGEWVPQTGGGGTYTLPIATASTLGGIKVGSGLEIDANGVLSATGGGGGGDSIDEGDGITITTDPQTGVKTISVNTGDNLEVDPNTGELNVTGVDYTAGKGIFIGNEYQNVEYIKNSGNYDQIILTDIIPTFSDKIELDIKFGTPSVATVWDSPIMGCYGTTPSTFLYTVTLYLASNDSNLGCYNHFKYETGNTGRNFFIRPSGISYDGSSSDRKTLTMKGSTATWGADSKEFSSEYNSSFIDPQIGIAVFGRAGQSSNIIFNSCELTVYGVKLYDSNDTLLHNLVPVKKLSNNEGGLYDTVTNKFYGNSGNGSFVTGPAVETDDRIINAKIGNGLQFDSNNAIEVNTGDGLQFDNNGAIEAPVMGASGTNHSSGLVPDPGSTQGTTKFLREDGTWAEPESGGETYEAGNGIEITEVTHEDEFRVQNQEYFFTDHGLTCILTGNYGPRTYTKINDGDIVAAVIGTTGGWYMPLFVGLTEDSVKYSNSYDSNILGPNGSFTYHDKTWYYTADYALTAGDGVDHAGHLQSMTDTIYAETAEGKIQAAKDLIDLAVLLPDVSTPTINAKIGAGLSFDANGAIQATAQPLSPATDSTLGGVIVGDGILVDNDGTISVDSTIIPEVTEYEAGTAISIEEVEHGGVTFDAWDSGTGWENVCYSDSTGNSVVNYQYEAHSPISNSYTLPTGATRIRAIAYDQNDTMLWTSFSWIDSNNYHFASTSPEDGHYNDWFEIPTGAVKVNFGVRHSKLNITTAMSLNDIKSVDITVQTLSEIEVDVWNGGTGWLNGNYYSGNSDTFTTSWYYSYHSNPDAYIPIPNGATHVMVMGISNENDTHFEGGGVNVFSSESHSNHIYWWGCAWEWHEISSDAKFVQIDVKWNDNNTRTISGSDIKSVTLVWKFPALETNQAINVKYGDGLTVNQNNELEVNLGSGLQFDANGAIEVVGGGSSGGNGDYTAGEAIEFRSTQLSFNVDAIRWDISNIKSTSQDSGSIWTQVRYIEFCDDSGTPYTISSASGIWDDNTSITYSTTSGSQTINDMIANTQKMCAIWRYPNHTMQLTFNLDTAVPCADIAKFRIKLGDDYPYRDPKSWKVYFRDAATQIWYIVQDITDAELSDTRDIWSNYYPFDITGATSINVKYGTGLTIDPITGELFVDGQLPEGTIIKKLTYTGTGTDTNNIHFDKKPLAILSLNGSSGQNYGSLIPTFIDSPYLHGVYGGPSNSGTTFRSSMSYDDSTNVLSITNTSDEGLAFNIVNKPYVMYYLIKGHAGSGTSATNEVSVVKTFSYTGTGTTINNIQFPETPDYILNISGPLGSVGDIITDPIDIQHPTTTSTYIFHWTQNGSGLTGRGLYSFNDSTNVLTLDGQDYGATLNYADNVYYVRYVVNETIGVPMDYQAGEAIDINAIIGSIPTAFSNNDFITSITRVNAGNIVKAADNSYFTLTATGDDCYTSAGDSSGSYAFTVKPSTKYRLSWDSSDTSINGMVILFENQGYTIMHSVDQAAASYIDFTTDPGCRFFTTRFGITYAGNSITFSNIQLVEIIDDTDAYNEISVKYAEGLEVNNLNELKVKLGTGLAFDPQTGAINVTGGGGGSGDTVAEGDGISITTDQQTGDKVIAVNAGSGLQVNQTTNELEVSSGVVTSIAPTQNTPGSITVTDGGGTATPVSVISQLGGATSSTAGTAGYVPAPASGDDDAYLRGDGTWDDSVVTEDDELTLVFVPDDYQPS